MFKETQEDRTVTTHYMGLMWFLLPFIKDGSKDLEIRVADERRKRIRVGDIIDFNSECKRLVVDIRTYSTFEEMLKSEDPSRVAPDETKERILSTLRGIYGPKESLGVLVFELVPTT